MKHLLLTFFAFTFFILSAYAQEHTFTKDDFMGTWRVCYGVDIEETADTLRFQKSTPRCLENNCGEHQWSFRDGQAIEFVFTQGCDTGFNSVSRSPKRWIYIEKTNFLKLMSHDGFHEMYFVHEKTDTQFTVIRRRDLE